MTQTINARLDEAKRERAETEVQKHALTKERFNVEHSYQRLAALGREEAQLRERNIEVLQRERAVFLNKMLFLMVGAGVFGAFLAGLMTEIARWLWAAFLAVAGSVGAALAAWWNS